MATSFGATSASGVSYVTTHDGQYWNEHFKDLDFIVDLVPPTLPAGDLDANLRALVDSLFAQDYGNTASTLTAPMPSAFEVRTKKVRLLEFVFKWNAAADRYHALVAAAAQRERDNAPAGQPVPPNRQFTRNAIIQAVRTFAPGDEPWMLAQMMSPHEVSSAVSFCGVIVGQKHLGAKQQRFALSDSTMGVVFAHDRLPYTVHAKRKHQPNNLGGMNVYLMVLPFGDEVSRAHCAATPGTKMHVVVSECPADMAMKQFYASAKSYVPARLPEVASAACLRMAYAVGHLQLMTFPFNHWRLLDGHSVGVGDERAPGAQDRGPLYPNAPTPQPRNAGPHYRDVTYRGPGLKRVRVTYIPVNDA